MCPACGGFLLGYDLDGIEVEACPCCGGSWLEAGELEWIVEQAGGDAAAVRGALARGGARTRRRCPRCRKRLRAASLFGVELDRCPRGHGLWCDRGELEALVHSGGGEAEALARFLRELYRAELAACEVGG